MRPQMRGKTGKTAHKRPERRGPGGLVIGKTSCILAYTLESRRGDRQLGGSVYAGEYGTRHTRWTPVGPPEPACIYVSPAPGFFPQNGIRCTTVCKSAVLPRVSRLPCIWGQNATRIRTLPYPKKSRYNAPRSVRCILRFSDAQCEENLQGSWGHFSAEG